LVGWRGDSDLLIQYQEYPPPPALSSFVECFWTCRVGLDDRSCSYRVLPDNCIDILWQDQRGNGFVSGMMTTSSTVILEPMIRTVAVRFRPGRASHFFRVPLDELTNLRAVLRDLWGRAASDRVTDALWTHPLTDRARIDVLERHLTEYLASGKTARHSGIVDHAIAAIQSSNGLLKIELLADTIGVSRQHLATQFRERVGITTKMFARIYRFRHVVANIRDTHTPVHRIDWAILAQDCGYADQSHLIHEFREFTGNSPEPFAQEIL
jgi:AraC-like DNA-binding protein